MTSENTERSRRPLDLLCLLYLPLWRGRFFHTLKLVKKVSLLRCCLYLAGKWPDSPCQWRPRDGQTYQRCFLGGGRGRSHRTLSQNLCKIHYRWTGKIAKKKKNLRPLFNQWVAKLKPVAPYTCDCSRALILLKKSWDFWLGCPAIYSWCDWSK